MFKPCKIDSLWCRSFLRWKWKHLLSNSGTKDFIWSSTTQMKAAGSLYSKQKLKRLMRGKFFLSVMVSRNLVWLLWITRQMVMIRLNLRQAAPPTRISTTSCLSWKTKTMISNLQSVTICPICARFKKALKIIDQTRPQLMQAILIKSHVLQCQAAALRENLHWM